MVLENAVRAGGAATAVGPDSQALSLVTAGGVEHDRANPSAQGFFRDADECDFHARPHFIQVAQTMPSLALLAPQPK